METKMKGNIPVYQSLFYESPQGMALFNLSGRCMDVNSSFLRISGASREEILSLDFRKASTWGEPKYAGILLKAIESLNNTNFFIENRPLISKPLIAKGTLTVFRQNNESVLLFTIEDRSQQKLHETELIQNRDLMQNILNMNSDVIYIYDLVGKKNIYSNDKISTILGYSLEEIQAMGENLISSLMHPDDFQVYIKSIINRYWKLADKELIDHNYRMKNYKGDYIWLNSKEYIFKRNERGEPIQIFGIISDINDKIMAEERERRGKEKLSISQNKYRKLFENMHVAFALHQIHTNDQGKPDDYTFLEVNNAFEKMTGLSAKNLIGNRVTQAIPGIESDPADWIGVYGRVALEGEVLNFEQFAKPLNRWYAVTVYSPEKGQFVTIFQDITEQKKVEENLQQNQKMESIGQLAGGIAHDFNNQLAGIVGFAELLQNELANNRELAEYVENILLSTKRASDLTSQLLAFAHKGKYQTVNINLHSIIEEVINILERTIDRKITIKKEFEAPTPYVMGDPTQIQNAIMNIGLNSRDAMPQGGELIFSTTLVDLMEKDHVSPLDDINPGKYVVISISDNGTGMDENTRKKIFEPFFTTKSMGRGTGMGLASVYGTIKNHGGAITVSSEPGQGTTMKLYFLASERN